MLCGEKRKEKKRKGKKTQTHAKQREEKRKEYKEGKEERYNQKIRTIEILRIQTRATL